MKRPTSKKLSPKNKNTKRHNTAATSKESFKNLKETGQGEREKDKVFNAIKEYEPLTSRMLVSIMGVERTNITRSLNDLINEATPKVRVAYVDKCATTGRRVQYYAQIDWPQIPLFRD